MPQGVQIVPQGEYVARSLKDYLQRHEDIRNKCTTGSRIHYLTTEQPHKFKENAQIFLREDIHVEHIDLH